MNFFNYKTKFMFFSRKGGRWGGGGGGEGARVSEFFLQRFQI